MLVQGMDWLIEKVKNPKTYTFAGPQRPRQAVNFNEALNYDMNEMRIDPSDGNAYTRQAFVDYYGEWGYLSIWNQAQPVATADSDKRPLRVEDALAYLERVKVTFASDPKVYSDFLDIMKAFKNKDTDTPGVIRRVVRLFGRAHADLILQFNTFLPLGYKIAATDLSNPEHPAFCSVEQPTPPDSVPSAVAQVTADSDTVPMSETPPRARQQVDFNSAIQFVTTVRRAYPSSDKYRRFLEILQGYSMEQSRTNISDVHSQVQDLFSDRPDLVVEFERFLPDNSTVTCRI